MPVGRPPSFDFSTRESVRELRPQPAQSGLWAVNDKVFVCSLADCADYRQTDGCRTFGSDSFASRASLTPEFSEQLIKAASMSPDRVTSITSWHRHIPFAFAIVGMLRPNTFVELGTHCGDSYSAFCQATRAFDLQTKCFAVDTWEGDSQAGYYGDEVFRELSVFHDKSYGEFSELLRMRFDQALPLFEEGRVDLLHIDGLHTYEAVKEDFETWLPKMSDSGLILFHDTNVRDREDFQVWRLWQEVTAERPHFEFKYGFGLGVLGVGNDLPASVLEFFDWASREPEVVESFFLKQSYDVDASALESVRGQRDQLISERDQLISERDQVMSEREQLIDQLDELGRQHQHAQKIVAERDGQLESVNQHLRQTGGELAHAMKVVDERDQRIATLLEQMDVARQELSAAHSRMAHERQALQKVNEEFQAAQQTLAEVELAAGEERRAVEVALKQITGSRWWRLRNAIWSLLGARGRVISSESEEKG